MGWLVGQHSVQEARVANASPATRTQPLQPADKLLAHGSLSIPLSSQGRWPLFDELQALDPEVYRSLVQVITSFHESLPPTSWVPCLGGGRHVRLLHLIQMHACT